MLFLQDKLLDKELKAPYIPPPEKLLSENEIKTLEAEQKLVVEEIMVLLIFIYLLKIN